MKKVSIDLFIYDGSTAEYLNVLEKHSSASTTKSPSEIEFRRLYGPRE